ncbi:hypothetical protein PHACT_04545 [Pseudohongiella acticola]|uniref:Pyridine nucleotide-disulphide oxidoreductase dimerisation domain-containing protein n=1 Tax=Pseudohongiella acticola TaxID=1524254 RepID=A0A1E8CJ38_9GAMM|nr:hypothetical protein PHACT_04545 [Pseudohongiella acticola]
MKSQLTPNWFTARQTAETVYGFKMLVEEESDLILGARPDGPFADEIIGIFGLAIRQKLTAEQPGQRRLRISR